MLSMAFCAFLGLSIPSPPPSLFSLAGLPGFASHGEASPVVKRPKRFSFYFNSGILFNVKWKHGQGCIK